MARVVYDHVTKQFDGTLAVDELMLDIHDGEFLVLVGPSGCGKSTALRCLAGLEEISSGNILIGDRVVTNMPPKDRDIAMVFQNYALYPHMTVRDNLAFGLKLRRTARADIDRRVTQVSEILGIGELLDRKPKQLSGGQRQRVALGRAIVREPQVFLMDEPLSNLDAKLRVQTRAEIIKLQQRLETTTLYVTHDQVEAMTMGHRIAVMNRGVLQQLDTPQRLYDFPANLFVATFIGSPAMNVFPARAVANGHGVEVASDGLELHFPPVRSAGLQDRIGQEIVVGIRPEHLSVVADGAAPAGERARLVVELVEPLGSETLLHLRGPADTTLVAKVDPQVRAKTGETVELAIDTSRLHAFDPATEQALV